MPDTTTVPMDNTTTRFYQGVTAANRVIEAHASTDFPDQLSRVNLFWFYVGALASAPDEYAITEQDDFSSFILGATTRAPSLDQDDDDPDAEDEGLASERAARKARGQIGWEG